MIDVGGDKFFACDECPIVEQFERRMALAIEHPEYGGFQFDHCGCDKLYDEFWQYGYCEDAWVDVPKHQHKGKRKTGRAYRRKMSVQKFNRQRDIVLKCGTRAMRLGVDRNNVPVEDAWFHSLLKELGVVHEDESERNAYIKRTKSSKYKKFYKNYSNRVVRRNTDQLPKGNQYRRLYDFWWAVY